MAALTSLELTHAKDRNHEVVKAGKSQDEEKITKQKRNRRKKDGTGSAGDIGSAVKSKRPPDTASVFSSQAQVVVPKSVP